MAVQKKVTADGFDIRYEEAGEGPALIVLHGAGGPRWSPALDLLANDHRVLLLELPGWGDAPNERSQSLADLAHTVVAAMDALGLERAHVMGTSLGGAVALHVALDHPEQRHLDGP